MALEVGMIGKKRGVPMPLDWPLYAQTNLRGAVMRQKIKCGAYARTTGNPCQAKALTNGRCKNHGGLSTGPKTQQGRQAISEAIRQRMAYGGRIRALEGFYRWLDGGGREMLSRLAKNREKRKRWERLMHKQPHASRTGA